MGLGFEKHQQYKTKHKKMLVGGGGERAEATLDSLPAEALCSTGANCKRNICRRGCFELLGGKMLFFCTFSKKFLYIFMQRMHKNEMDHFIKCNFVAGKKNKVRCEILFFFNAALGKKEVRQQVENTA